MENSLQGSGANHLGTERVWQNIWVGNQISLFTNYNMLSFIAFLKCFRLQKPGCNRMFRLVKHTYRTLWTFSNFFGIFRILNIYPNFPMTFNFPKSSKLLEANPTYYDPTSDLSRLIVIVEATQKFGVIWSPTYLEATFRSFTTDFSSLSSVH